MLVQFTAVLTSTIVSTAAPTIVDELHGLGVSRRIEQMTQGAFQVKPGSLFPALHRMEEAGWLAATWGESETNRRAKYYRLTSVGRKHLAEEASTWGRLSGAIARVMQTT